MLSIAMAEENPVPQAEVPKVVALKRFPGSYPSSSSLSIPFTGCVVLDRKLGKNSGEQWLSVDELIKDPDFKDLYVLVNGDGSLLGGRVAYKGSLADWRGEPGFKARLRVLEVFCPEEATVSKALPMTYDGSDFGGMIYTFRDNGEVSWRKKAAGVENEKAYIERQETHVKSCPECQGTKGYLPQVVASIEGPVTNIRRDIPAEK
ncbi:MAG: hypothetical protein QM755_10445 [Luteolibacter sp.]